MRSFRHRHRQVAVSPPAAPASPFTGASTFAGGVPPVTSISIDESQTASIPGLLPSITATITSSSTASSDSETPSETQSAAPENSSSARTAISTGAIIGIAVGTFALLAILLIIVMTVRYRRQRRARSGSGARRPARKSWTRIDEPAPLQMRATNTGSIVDGNTRGGDESFLSMNSTRGLLSQPPPPSQNPFLAQHPSQQSFQSRSLAPQLPPVARVADESHIPNPFSSPLSSPSHSPAPSHGSAHSSAHAPTAPPLLSAPRAHTVSVAASSVSDYPYSFTDPEEPPSRFSAEPIPAANAPARLWRKPSSKEQNAHARERELRAMQNLISALDRGPPPSSFPTVDTSTGSRLSRGEGLVTPGGHSPKDNQTATGDYWTTGDERLPPADVFRAALRMGERD